MLRLKLLLSISLTLTRVFFLVVDARTTGRVENTTSDADVPRRFDTRSKLTIRAQPDDNDADYTCEARHPALIAPKRATVALNILCKFSLPV